MKLIHEAGLSRRRAPPFAGVADLEVLQLRKLSPWIRWLYLELRMLSDFKTGHLTTSWAVLEALMACDDYQAFSPTLRMLRRAIDLLEEVRLLERFPEANESKKQLFLKVMPVTHFRSRAEFAGRPAVRAAGRPRNKQKPSKHAASSEVDASSRADLRAEQRAGDSIPREIKSPNPLSERELSTSRSETMRSARDALKHVRDEIAARRNPKK